MKPAWPIENWPVTPLTMLRLTARMMVIADEHQIREVVRVEELPVAEELFRKESNAGRPPRSSAACRTRRGRRSSLDLLPAAVPGCRPGLKTGPGSGSTKAMASRQVERGRRRTSPPPPSQAADQRAGDAADAAEHRGDERLEAGHDAPSAARSGVLDARTSRPARAGERRAEHERERDDPVRRGSPSAPRRRGRRRPPASPGRTACACTMYQQPDHQHDGDDQDTRSPAGSRSRRRRTR